MREDFIIFILSHGRATTMKTLNTIKKEGYTGKYKIVVDSEDNELDKYISIYGKSNVVVFNKSDIAREFDSADLSTNMNTVVYARNVCFQLATELNCRYFLELDDDYTRFEYRVKEEEKLKTYEIKDFDSICCAMIDFLNCSNALSVAFAQGGDLIGGLKGTLFNQRLKRKAMNSFFCDTQKPFKFVGRINEDVNTYTTLGSRGNIFLTIADIDLIQSQTQSLESGMSDIYNDLGTYLKSFYTVIMMPSSVSIDMMGETHQRIHHKIDWETCVPKILSSKYKL